MADDDAAIREERAITRSVLSEAGPSETASGGGPPVAGNSHVEDGVVFETNLDRKLSVAKVSNEEYKIIVSLIPLDEISLTAPVLNHILDRFPLKELFQAPAICKDFKETVETKSFLDRRASRCPVEECSLFALSLYVQKGRLHILGYDSSCRDPWTRFPPSSAFNPGEGLLVAGDLGIFCLITRTAGGPGNFVVWNPLTKERRDLEPLNKPRHPAVSNIQVTIAEKRYKVIAIGSVPRSDLSTKTEVYDSVTMKWTYAADVPAKFSLSDSHQTGAFCKSKGLLYLLGRVRRSCFDQPEAVLAFDVEKGRWIPMSWDLPFTGRQHCQLVECGGRIFVFSRELSGGVEFQHIDRLNFLDEGGFSWTSKVTRRIERKQHLLKPEYTLVPVGEARLGIFKRTFELNVMSESICEVYDITEDESVETEASHLLPSPRFTKGAVLVPVENHLGFAFQPSFYTKC